MPEIIEVLIGSPDFNQIAAASGHAGSVISRMEGVLRIQKAGCFSAAPVDTAFSDDLLDGWVAEGMKSRIVISNLIEVQHNLIISLEGAEDSFDKRTSHDRVRIAEHDDVATTQQYTQIIEQMFVIVD